MEICPGHTIDRGTLEKAHRSIQSHPGKFFDVIAWVVRIANTASGPTPDFWAGSSESGIYDKAVCDREWNIANKLYLDRLEIRDPLSYRNTLRMEALARGFRPYFAAEISGSKILYRGMDPQELPSYINGTFKSKTEGKACRGYKALSIGRNIHMDRRAVSMEVPIDRAIRDALVPATYTALPQPIEPKDERLYDWKHISNAHETECRLPDGTCVPRGTRIRVRRDMPNSASELEDIRPTLDLLSGVAEIEIV